MSEKHDGRQLVRIGSDYVYLPTLKECEEFSRAVDAFFMVRGLTGYGKPIKKPIIAVKKNKKKG